MHGTERDGCMRGNIEEEKTLGMECRQCHKFMKCYEFFSTHRQCRHGKSHCVWHTIKHIKLLIAIIVEFSFS